MSEETMIRVDCSLTDCTCFRRRPDDPRHAYCAHPDKAFYMKNPCPLYKKGFTADKYNELKARFIKR